MYVLINCAANYDLIHTEDKLRSIKTLTFYIEGQARWDSETNIAKQIVEVVHFFAILWVKSSHTSYVLIHSDAPCTSTITLWFVYLHFPVTCVRLPEGGVARRSLSRSTYFTPTVPSREKKGSVQFNSVENAKWCNKLKIECAGN